MLKFVQSLFDETAAIYKTLVEKSVQIFSADSESNSGSENTFTNETAGNSSKSLRRLSHDMWTKCPSNGLVEIMSRISNVNCARGSFTSEDGATRPTTTLQVLGENLEDLSPRRRCAPLARLRLPFPLPRNPLWGTWARPWTRRMFVASSLCTVVPVGAWVAHPKDATLHGQGPPGNNSRRSVTHHRTCHAGFTDTWLTLSFTSQSP